jgi:hypothetical protein
MSSNLTACERLAAEAAQSFLRYALDSLDRAEHFAATARLPETYLELRAARESLIRAADRLTRAADTAVPLAWETCAKGDGASSAPAAKTHDKHRAGREKHQGA